MLPKVAVFGPCVGVGGGDHFFSSLIRYANRIEFTGVFVEHGATVEQYARAEYQTGRAVKFHQGGVPESGRHSACKYHATREDAMRAAMAGAEVLINWHCLATANIASEIAIPLVEVSQNEDDYARVCAQATDAITSLRVAVSQAAGEASFPGKEFRIIHNGIEIDRCLPQLGRETLRELWEIAGHEVVVLFAGRLAEEKRPEVLLDSLAYLPPNYSLLYVGEGKRLENLASVASERFPGRVRYLPAQYRLGDFFAASDIFVLPSKVEGDSLALKEALVSGIPCVASDAGNASELAEFLTLIPKNVRAQGLAEAILFAQQRGRNDAQRGTFCDRFSISAIAREWEGMLTAIACESRQKKIEAESQALLNVLKHSPVRVFTEG